VYRSVDWDWNAAESSYRLSLVCNPSNEGAHRLYAQFLAARGRLSEARLIADKARELDPMCLVVNTSGAWVHYLVGDFEKAIDMCRHTLDMERQFPAARRVIAASFLQMGQVQRAVSELEAVNETAGDPVSAAWLAHALAVAGETARAGQILNELRGTGAGGYVSAYHVALAQVGLGDANGALASLDRASSERDPALIGTGVDPRFQPLRFSPRYHALLERLGLHDGQSETRKATA
jgi:tetratricopeptide (TPR) repeat protein